MMQMFNHLPTHPQSEGVQQLKSVLFSLVGGVCWVQCSWIRTSSGFGIYIYIFFFLFINVRWFVNPVFCCPTVLPPQEWNQSSGNFFMLSGGPILAFKPSRGPRAERLLQETHHAAQYFNKLLFDLKAAWLFWHLCAPSPSQTPEIADGHPDENPPQTSFNSQWIISLGFSLSSSRRAFKTSALCEKFRW